MTSYEVHLPVFDGPFDLLLQLIEREKLDISAVSLAVIADQFLRHVEALGDRISASELADFLAIAARLILIKSRLLLPPPARPADEEEEEDPAEALARQLREYKRFKQVAQSLRCIEERGLRSYPRAGPLPVLERRLDIGDATLADLLAAARAAFAARPLQVEVPAGVVVPFNLTIHDQILVIRSRLSTGRVVTFAQLVARAIHRMEIIVTLLAILELIKRRQITVQQGDLFGEIEIAPMAGVEITDEAVEENGNGA